MADASLRERRQQLLDRRDLGGLDYCRAYAGEADAWLSALADAASGSSDRHLALLAVGGYGRGQLCPWSDLDVVLVHDGRGDISQVAEAIWYPVWDEGVQLDHSVRRPREMLEAAGEDLRVALGLLDGRLVWGSPKVAEPLLEEIVAVWRSRLGARWLPALVEQMAERHRTQGDVAFLLEPDLKESHGGLRDVNVLEAVSSYAPLLADYVDLASIRPAFEVLTEVRVELHRSAQRSLDRLLLQEQDHVGAVLGYDDADALMGAVSAAGRAIAWVSDDAWRRRNLWQPTAGRHGKFRHRLTRGGRPFRPGDPDPVGSDIESIEPGIEVCDGEVGLSTDAPTTTDASLPLRLAAVSAERDLPIARRALHRLAAAGRAPGDPWPPPVLAALVRALAAGPAAIAALESLDQQGLLVRLLPEWQSVRNKPQRNAYHRFTVDRHLLEAATNAAALTGQVDRTDLLVVGTLLHDIGKGYPGDHTEAGIPRVGRIATRMGFAPDDVATLQTMVRHHLLLPDTATRRDLDDPATIERVMEAVGDRPTLALLAAMTEADSLATGPSAWGTWKAGLVAELVSRVSTRLGGTESPTGRGRVPEIYRSMMAGVRQRGVPEVLMEAPRVVVAAPDRRGLLASVTGVMALHGLDVRSADAIGDDGVAVEVFSVTTARGRWPEADRLGEDLQAVLEDRLSLGDELDAKAKAYERARRPDSARPVVPSVTVDNGASATSTVVEVRALDRVGLLHRITRALFDCDLDVVAARVSTLGSEVVDAFYVRDGTGAKVAQPDDLARIEAEVLGAVS